MSDRAPQARKQAKSKRKVQRRSPGYTARPHRVELEKALIRVKVRGEQPAWDEAQVKAEVEKRFEDLMPKDPQVRKQYDLTAPVSVSADRKDVHELVEVAAMRRLQVGMDFEGQLRFCGDGRPSDRLLSTTIFERNIFETGRPEVWCHMKELYSDYRLLHWAYDWPVAHGGARHFSNIYRTLEAQLERWNDEDCIAFNIRALLELRDLLGCDDIGRWVVLDGTDIPVAREQRQHDPDFPEEEEFLRRGLEDADFAHHGSNGFTRKAWRGPRLIVLVCVLTSLPIAWVVKRGSRPEYEALEELLSLTFRHWPEWTPEALVADAHFDNDPTHRLCEERYGIHLISSRAGKVDEDKFKWAASDGTPVCSKHGDMKLLQSEGFVDVNARRQVGLKPGEPADLSKAAFRWQCPGELDELGNHRPCDIHARVMWKDNPRLYTFFPRRGIHKNRIARRKALTLRRNVGESVYASLKGMGIGLRGQSAPRWVSSDHQMRWLLGGTLLGLTLRRLAHESGVYSETHAEADDKELLTASVPSKEDLREVTQRMKSGGWSVNPKTTATDAGTQAAA